MANETRRRYTDEFRREAVKLVEEEGRKVSEVARNLGIGRSMLDRWRQQFRKGPEADGAPGGCSAEERQELKRLLDERQGPLLGRKAIRYHLCVRLKPVASVEVEEIQSRGVLWQHGNKGGMPA